MSTVEASDGNPEKRSRLDMHGIQCEMESLGSHLDYSHRHFRAIEVGRYRLRTRDDEHQCVNTIRPLQDESMSLSATLFSPGWWL
jgi:hypothetical protein